MKLRGAKRIAISLAASAAMVGGLALAAPATASAASGYDKPVLKVEQGDFGGDKNVQLTITNPNDAGLFDLAPTCTAALLDGEKALKALVAFNDGDLGDIVDIIFTPGVRLGTPAINLPLSPNKSQTNAWNVPDGVYVAVGVCGGSGSLLGDVGIAVKPVIVPDGIGSISPALAFGSLLLESGDAIMDVLPLLTGLGSAGGALS